ncbi:uncharacterized protein [Nicotiana tomentosiformis]|uniref:uncharacterized protein n=1 Tax=Nicotiana tomentosiformis TaxID=4098 RepID=UPI00388C884A
MPGPSASHPGARAPFSPQQQHWGAAMSVGSIVSVCHRDASILFDSGSTYLYVSSYFAHCLDMTPESLVLSAHVSTLVDWLSPCHAVLDCHAKTVTLAMPGILRVEWRDSIDHVPSRVILYLKAQRMVEKGCLSYLAFVRDVSAETPAIDSIPVVHDFSNVFPADLPGMPPDMDIDFGIALIVMVRGQERVEREAKRPRGQGGFSDALSGG